MTTPIIEAIVLVISGALIGAISQYLGWRRGTFDGYCALRHPRDSRFQNARQIIDAKRESEGLLTIQEEYEEFSKSDSPYKTGWLGYRR